MITGIGVQTKNVVYDENPLEGFMRLKEAGFTCCDFSLNDYLTNTDIYKEKVNKFFDKSSDEMCEYFRPHKEAATAAGIRINQMHMPYPITVMGNDPAINDYLWNKMAVRSMELAAYFECPNIVVHGLKMTKYLGSEEAEWAETAKFLDHVAPMAVASGTTICIENLYNGQGGHMIDGPCCDAYKAAERIDYFNDKYGCEVLGFCYDVGHGNLVGLDVEKFLTVLGKRLKVLHIHDNDGVRDLHQLPFTFSRTRENTSSTDWEGFYKGLKNAGFEGVLSFETAPVLNCFPPELHDDVLRMIARIGEYMKARVEAI